MQLVRQTIVEKMKQIKIDRLLLLVAVLYMLNAVQFFLLEKIQTRLSQEAEVLTQNKEYIETSLKERILKKAISLKIERSNKNLSYEDINNISELIFYQSKKLGIDPLLTASVIITESRFYPEVVSRKGAVGLMQIKPSTANYIAELIEYGKEIDPHSLKEYEHNITLGLSYLKHLINKFDGSLEKGLIAYNIGEYNLSKRIRNGDRIPQRYLNKVNRYYKEMKEKYNYFINITIG